MLNNSELDLVRRLTDASAFERPMTVDEVAASLRVSASRASQLLRRLAADGVMERRQTATPRGRVVHYVPKSWMEVQWSSRAERVSTSWRAFGEIDWEFPLVSQVPDEESRSTLYTFLRALRQAGLLYAEAGLDTSTKKRPVPTSRGVTLVVYGSAARGTARPGSDLDVLLFHDGGRPPVVARLQTLASQVSLAAPRSIQLALVRGAVSNLPPTIRDEVAREGLIVHDGLRERPGGPSLGFWRPIYGGRSRGHG